MITDLIAAYTAYVLTGGIACLSVVGGWNLLKRLVSW